MWRGQPYIYPLVRSSTVAGDVALVVPIDSVAVVMTLR
jgi:hypothetical protein